MITKTIKYTDFKGNEKTEECKFHLSKTDLIEMNFSTPGGMEKMLKRISETQDVKTMLDVYKDLILRSYGEVSDDGNSFIRVRDGRRLADEFAETAAFDELYMELMTNEDSLTEFVNGIVPQSVRAEIAARG